MVTRSELPKLSKSTGSTEKSTERSGVSCYVCGEGHRASKCPKKFSGDKVLVTKTNSDEDDWNPVYMSCNNSEVALYTKFDILLDSEASINVFSNIDLLTDVRPSPKSIVMLWLMPYISLSH
jgi:hypothetical protein